MQKRDTPVELVEYTRVLLDPAVYGQPCYQCVLGTPSAGNQLTIFTSSTEGAIPDPTPIFDYRLCATCPISRTTVAVPGYTPGSCIGCDVISVAPSQTALPALETTTVYSTIRVTYAVTYTSGSSVYVASSVSTAISAIATEIGSSVAPGLVTVLTSMVTATVTTTTTATFINSLGSKFVSPCPVLATTTSPVIATYTVPPEMCTTYTTTIQGQETVCTEPLPAWTPCLTTATVVATPAPGLGGPQNGQQGPAPGLPGLGASPGSSQPGAGSNPLAGHGANPDSFPAAASNFTQNNLATVPQTNKVYTAAAVSGKAVTRDLTLIAGLVTLAFYFGVSFCI